MKKTVVFLISLSLIFSLSSVESKVFKIETSGNNQQMNIDKVSVQPGNPSTHNSAQNAFQVAFFDFNGNLLEPQYPFEDIFGTNILAETLRFLFSYNQNAEFVTLLNNEGEVIGNKYIGYLSESCGNGICALHESEGDCPIDCPVSLDDYCSNPHENDGVCDPDCLALAPEQEPFSLDPDCTPPTFECIQIPVCHLNAVFTCILNRDFEPHWFKLDVCQLGETCENGYCDNGLQIIDVSCQSNDDCIVNGDAEHFFCNCVNKCQKTSNNRYSLQCCNGRLNE